MEGKRKSTNEEAAQPRFKENSLSIAMQLGHVTLIRTICAEKGCAQLGDLIVERKLDGIWDLDQSGWGAVHYAAKLANVRAMETLLQGGGKDRDAIARAANLAGQRGLTASHIAAKMGHSRMLKVLLLHGARMNGAKNGQTPFDMALEAKCHRVVRMIATHYGCAWVAEWFILRGCCSLNTANSRGESVLTHAVKAHDLAAVIMLLEIGVQVNRRDVEGTTALHHAAASDDLELVTCLVNSGAAEIAVRNLAGLTPLCMAIDKRQEGTVQWLLARMTREDVPRTTAHRAVLCGNNNILRLLAKSGHLETGVNARDEEGKTPLHLATRSNDLGVAGLLLEHGADIDAREACHTRRTPLHLALLEGRHLFASYLLQMGADAYSADANGDMPVQLIALRGYVDLLESVGPSQRVNADNSEGMTALHYAARLGHLATARELLRRMEPSVAINAATIFGLTAQQEAEESGHVDVVRLLAVYSEVRTAQELSRRKMARLRAEIVRRNGADDGWLAELSRLSKARKLPDDEQTVITKMTQNTSELAEDDAARIDQNVQWGTMLTAF